MFIIKNLSLRFNNQVIFDNAGLHVSSTDRIGLVGRNGAGKSTLLRLIAQGHPAVQRIGSKKIGYVPQEITLSSDLPVREEVISWATDLDEQDRIMLQVEGLKMLAGLGFSQEQLQMPASSLSVGWRMRLVLAQLLLQKADFYLFDEPTNHLDLIAKDWLIDYLKSAPWGFMIVCHDRYVLDVLCDKVVEVERGALTSYSGNYEAYEAQKAENLERLKAAYAVQQKDLARKRETIERFRASASKAAMAKSMERQLEKVEVIQLPPEDPEISFEFPKPASIQRQVLAVQRLTFGYDAQKPIFSNISFGIERGWKVAIVARNGVGKTTLLNVAQGRLAAQEGSVAWSELAHRAYFEQDQGLALDQSKSIMDHITAAIPRSVPLTVARSILGCFLFTGDSVDKKIRVLSGGEKNRVAMATVLLQQANVLLLDEPTNHLDIMSKKVLAQALEAYPGTILFVSHDRDFINRVATHILDLSPQRALLFEGNYESYLLQKRHVQDLGLPADNAPKASAPAQAVAPKNNNFESRKELASIERSLERIEAEISKLGLKLAGCEYGTPVFSKLSLEIDGLVQKKHELYARWEDLMTTVMESA